MIFQPLSPENFQSAIEFVKMVFPNDVDTPDSPLLAYRAALWPEENQEFWKKYDTKTLEYFVVLDEHTQSIIGVTGLYTRTIDPPNMVWLGWYGVHPAWRGKGLGKAILDWTMARAREKEFTVMRLYTSTDPNEAIAQHLYDVYGFRIIGEEGHPNGVYKLLYRERLL